MNRVFRSAVLATILVGHVFSQATTGQILGEVRDQTDALIPGVLVTAANEATGFQTPVPSDAEGRFVVPLLPPGVYSLTASKTGFREGALSGIELHVDQQLRVDLTLIAGSAESITVTAELHTQNTSLGMVIAAREIRDLPLLGRNFQDLLLLVPGVAPGAGGNISNYSVNGQREFSNSIVINGVEVTGNRNNDSNLRPSVDAVEEFKAITSAYSAEFGRSSAGVVTIQTRSGTNTVHGSAYEFVRTNKTTARSFFAPQPSALREHFWRDLGWSFPPRPYFLFCRI